MHDELPRLALPTPSKTPKFMKNLLRRCALVALLGHASAGHVLAATYFVNSNGGNDSYNGAAPAWTSGSNGPWQTLAKLAAVTLAPNDTVYLACGGVWNETLKVPSSGATNVPITITAGPGYCTTPPLIDGAATVPAHQWVQHSGLIYKAKLPIDLIANPNPGASMSGWTQWSTTGDSSMVADTACPGQTATCMAFTSGTSNSIASSNNFAISGGVEYTVGVQLRAAAGTPIKVVLRRAGPTYEKLAPDQWITTAGTWQSVGFMFRPSAAVANARLDVEVQTNRSRVNLREAHVTRSWAGDEVLATFVDSAQIRRAHHPNFGQAGNPDSVFAPVASSGNKVALDVTGLALPAGATLIPGLRATMRTVDWAIEERAVVGVASARLTLAAPTVYDILPGFGYYLTGALWMLDSPGEWFYDKSSSTVYVWMPDGATPGNRVAISGLELGVDSGKKSNIALNNLAIRHVGTGLAMISGGAVSVSGLSISDIADFGIRADYCATCSVSDVGISRTGLDAISAWNLQTTSLTVRDSKITDSGASDRTDGWRMLPRPSFGAIYSQGTGAIVAGNAINRGAKLGIHVGASSSVTDNFVTNVCLVLNDCGGIYVGRIGNNASIRGNVIENVSGNLLGLPGSPETHSVGIYLDDLNSGSVVSANTVTGADIGIQLHNANNALVSDNVLFGNRRQQLWLQERTNLLRGNGDVFGNSIRSNTLVPTATGPALYLQSELGDTSDFATFSGNHYSSLLSPRIINERSPTSVISMSVAEWQGRGREIDPRVTQPVGYAPFLAGTTNLIPNGNLASGKTGWTSWNQTAPLATSTVLSCGFANCIRLDAGASQSLLSSPNFSVTQGKWYRVTFDAATSQEGQPITAVVRRGGGENVGYAYLMSTAELFVGHTTWNRYSFAFQATKTVVAGDPATQELGARVDFERNLSGSSLNISRLELVTLTPAQAPLQIELLLNRQSTAASIDCAVIGVVASLCNSFVHLRDDVQVAWPQPIGPRTGSPVYTRVATLTDSDRDGIADQQDACPNTASVLTVNSRGCAISQ